MQHSNTLNMHTTTNKIKDVKWNSIAEDKKLLHHRISITL